LTVNSVTGIGSQPVGGSRCPGQGLTFSMTGSGTGPFTDQWSKGGANIAGATSASYVIASVVAGDAGDYEVVVTGTCGSATSSLATLTVNSATGIASQPVGGSRCPGQAMTFSITASGTGPFTYQWRKGGANIVGEIGRASSRERGVAGEG